MSIFDTYQMLFDRQADLEEINSVFDPGVIVMPVRENFRFAVESTLGGSFEMRNYHDEFGRLSTFVQGKHKHSVLHDLIADANYARKIVGMLEKYGDHLANCEVNDPEWVPEYDGYERSCSCGFASALSLDERNAKRMKESK